jgi:hypothetical protein
MKMMKRLFFSILSIFVVRYFIKTFQKHKQNILNSEVISDLMIFCLDTKYNYRN